MPQPFTLHCFPDDQPPPPLAISGSLARNAGSLILDYRVQGDIAQLDIPATSPHPERRDELWRATCFELFVAASGEHRYWEYNLSPSGHWNCYRFSAYRQQMTTESAISALPCKQTSRGDDQLQLTLSLPLPPALRDHQPLEIGISAVTQHRNGTHHYWALNHPGQQPDFHHRDGFALMLGNKQ